MSLKPGASPHLCLVHGSCFLTAILERLIIREFLAGKDHADSAELHRSAVFELPDWSELLSEPKRPQCVQPVGELHHLSEGVLLAPLRPRDGGALLRPADLLQMHAPQDHLQDGLQAGSEDGLP